MTHFLSIIDCPQLPACTQPSHLRQSAGLGPCTSVTVLDGESLWQNLKTHPAQAPGRGGRSLCREQRCWPGQSGQARTGWRERHGASCPDSKLPAVSFGVRQADETNTTGLAWLLLMEMSGTLFYSQLWVNISMEQRIICVSTWDTYRWVFKLYIFRVRRAQLVFTL